MYIILKWQISIDTLDYWYNGTKVQVERDKFIKELLILRLIHSSNYSRMAQFASMLVLLTYAASVFGVSSLK